MTRRPTPSPTLAPAPTLSSALLGWVTCLVLLLAAAPAVAQDAGDPPADAAVSPTVPPTVQVEAGVDDPMELVTVNWWEELVEGGVTMIFLGLLSVLMLAFAVERLIMLRRSRFVPAQLARDVRPLFLQKRYDAVLERCDKSDSTLSRVIAYMTHHRDADPMLLAQSAGDLGARELADQEARNVPFAVIAALAPLLGLLGTMIGMIEAFKLVEVFGDEGGASMLAGSISKALITTAVGLILAIPAIALFHWFKHRLHTLTQSLETQVDALFSTWFVLPQEPQPSDQPTERHLAQEATPPKPAQGDASAEDAPTNSAPAPPTSPAPPGNAPELLRQGGETVAGPTGSANRRKNP